MAGKYDRDVLFLAFKRLGRNEREAEAILDRVYRGRGHFEFETDYGSAVKLTNQFNIRNPFYRVVFTTGEIDGRAGIRVIARCVQPDAPWVNCCVCGTPVKTCERKKPAESDYCCPVHPNGAQLGGGGWVCSQECWEIAACPPLDKDRAEKIL